MASSLAAPRLPAQGNSGGIKLGLGMLDLSEATLKFTRQLGLEWLGCPRNTWWRATPEDWFQQCGGAPWRIQRSVDRAGIRRIKGEWNRSDCTWASCRCMVSRTSSWGRPKRRDIEHVQESIRIAGRLAIPVVEYNFLAIRPSKGYYVVPGRGGSQLRAFDYERIKSLPPLPEVGEVAAEEYWKRLTYFLKAVIPVAEKAGVRLALHPNDPPIETFRGTGLPLRSLADLKRLIAVVPSPSNGITLDTGVTREMGENVVETIRYFGTRDRINHVHFRNVRLKTRYTDYTETFIDEGDNDMLAAMRAFPRGGLRAYADPRSHAARN